MKIILVVLFLLQLSTYLSCTLKSRQTSSYKDLEEEICDINDDEETCKKKIEKRRVLPYLM